MLLATVAPYHDQNEPAAAFPARHEAPARRAERAEPAIVFACQKACAGCKNKASTIASVDLHK